jgi:hypothetical protein
MRATPQEGKLANGDDCQPYCATSAQHRKPVE